MTPRTVARFVSAILFAALLPISARGLGLREIQFEPIPPAPAHIVIDGHLDEWRSIGGYTYDPLGTLLSSGGDPTIAALLADPVSVTFKQCYDKNALYLAFEWHDRKAGTNQTSPGNGAHWFEGGEGFELHILTDRVLHLACWPSSDGATLCVMARYGDSKEWKDVSGLVTAATAPLNNVTTSSGAAPASTACAQEFRIPWSVVTAAGGPPPAGKFELGADFAWNAMPASLLDHLRGALTHSMEAAGGAVSLSFLTAGPGFAAKGYIGNPAAWGQFALRESASGDHAVRAPDGSTSLAVLPTPAAPKLLLPSGNLSDWDSSLFQTAGLYQAFFGNRFTCRVAAQCDNDNLYVAAHFASFGKMSNLKPESTQQGFNGGDNLQIRLNDGKKKINLCGWYDTLYHQSALTADGKDLPSPFLLQQGAQEAFAVDPDGHGYVQELAIPWKLLFGAAPSQLLGSLQFWFADLTPRFSLHGKITFEQAGAVSVPYKMPRDGQLTLGLFNSSGNLLKWLVQDEFRPAGDQRQSWDGLDQWGNAVPAGSYSLKAVYHAALSTQYKMSLDNPGAPPWPTPDGKGDWLGDESDPQAAATDGKWVFLASPDSEKGFSIIALDENGQRQWGVDSPGAPRCIALSVDGDYLYALYSGPETTVSARMFLGKDKAMGRAILKCFDKRTGNAARFTVPTPNLQVATWPYREEVSFLAELRNSKSFSPASYGGQPRYACSDIGETTSALGVAATGGKVYVSLLYDNKIIAIDAETGKPTGWEMPIDAPAGLAVLDSHTLLAVSGKHVLKVDLTARASSALITDGLSAPFGVTTDKPGNIYVSDWGDSFQVKAFDAGGRPIRAIGTPGGRGWVGKWDPNGMLVPRGIAVTDAGKLWVAEDDGSPCRVSVWDTTTGTLVRDYIGPTPYGGGTYFWADPKDPSLMNTEGVRFKVDLDAKSAIPEAVTFRRASRDDPFTPIGHSGAWGHSEIRYHDGREYLVTNTAPNMFTILQRNGDTYRAVAALGVTHHDLTKKFDGTEVDVFDSDLGGHHVYGGFFPQCFAGHGGENYTWTDMNGDNLVQPGEMHWMKTALAPYKDGVQGGFFAFWGGAVLANDWSLITVSHYRDRTAYDRIPLKGWTAAGAPIYDVADARPFAFDAPTLDVSGIYATHDDKLIVCYGYEGGRGTDSVACFDMQGNRLWAIARPRTSHEPTRQQAKQVHAQNAVYDFQIPNVGDVVGTWLWHGACRPYLFTTDGLYVGTVLDETLLGPSALWGESYTFYFQTPDGIPYIVNGGTQAEHILRIKGLESDSAGRFESTFQLSDADARNAAAVAAAQPVEVPSGPRSPLAVAWFDKAPMIDGDLSDWPGATVAPLDGGNGRTARIALGRDAQNLYLAYTVHEPNPMRNGGSDWQTLFLTGDCTDLMLQTDPKANPRRTTAADGDERLLFSMFQGHPIAVLYRPVVSKTASLILPTRLATAAFDQIIKLDSAKVAIRRGPSFYTLEACVPLSDLGMSNASGDLRGDAGVIFADESGHSRSLRLYYYNQHTQMVNDLATEATLQPAEWGKITFPVAH